MRKVTAGVGRGVWTAPWKGPNGELIIVAIDRENCRIAERLLAPGDDHVGAGDELWAALDAIDPMPILHVI